MKNRRKSQQISCFTCKNVAMLRARAAPLQAYIEEAIAASSEAKDQDHLSAEQERAAIWLQSMAKFLNNQAALHPRCGACSILLGPGHVEEGTDGSCSTHTSEDGRGESTSFKDSSPKSLNWIAEQVIH